MYALNRSVLKEIGVNEGLFYETEIKWINPREYHRKIISDIEDLGFTIPRGKQEELIIEKEKIGDKTGYIESRIKGYRESKGEGAISYPPYKNNAILFGILGLFVILLGSYMYSYIRISSILSVLGGVAVIIISIYFIGIREYGKFPVIVTSNIFLFATGEATERTIEKNGSDVTDLFSQLTVTCSGEIVLHVPKDYDGPVRKELQYQYIHPSKYEKVCKSSIPLSYETREAIKKEENNIKNICKELGDKISSYGTEVETKK